MKRNLFIVLFGFLPLWATVAFVIFAFLTMPGEHAALTLWIFVLAMPACAVTLAVTGVTLVVHAKSSGTPEQKNKRSFAFFLVAVLSLLIGAQYVILKKQDTEQRTLHEKRRAEEFVAQNPSVSAAIGAPVTASAASYSISSGSLPDEYDIYASGERGAIYAIVKPERGSKPTKFLLLCTTRQSPGQREASRHVCDL